MTRHRRIRDEVGNSLYYDIDEIADAVLDSTGAGIFDVFKNVGTKVATKLTGKVAKNIATKAAEKLVEKGAEKIGEKTGQLVGEKIYDRFTTRNEGPTPPAPPQPVINENKGDQIIKELQRGKKPPSPLKKPKKSISQQFDELLNL